MTGPTESRPEAVPLGAKRTGDTHSRWAWVEPSAWTERMLTALEQGVKGGKDALRRVDRLLKAGYTSIIDADLKSYFDTIPHDRLLALIRREVSDGRVLALIEAYLKQDVLDGLDGWTPAMGSPQGAVIS